MNENTTENHTKSEADKGSQNYLIYYKDTLWRTDLTVYGSLEWYMPKCTVLYIKVHCHNRTTKHFFFPPRPVKASPFIFTSEPRECKDKRQHREQRLTGGCWWPVARVWRGKGGKGGCRESYCGEGTVTVTRKTRVWWQGCKRGQYWALEVQEGGDEELGESGGSFNTQVGSKKLEEVGDGRGWGRRRGGGWGNSKEPG